MAESDRICLNCNGSGWVAGLACDWVRCPECTPEPPKPAKVEFHRGAKVRRTEKEAA